MPTLKDVAKASGVSLTQASRALNDYDDVSEQTKQKVRKAATGIGYVKNVNASRLALQSNNQISVVIYAFASSKHSEDNILIRMLNGIYGFAEEIGYDILPLFVSIKRPKSYLDYCKSRMIPGIIFIGARYDDAYFNELMDSDYPCVTIDTPARGRNKASVVIDDEKYSQAAVSEMIKRGYRRIGMINGHEYASVSIRRLQGYKSALLQNGLPFDESIVMDGGFMRDMAAGEARKLLGAKVDAIFCASDIMAIGALEAVQSEGYNVPGDVGLFGFDGLLLTSFVKPNISTVVQDNYQKGYEAAKLLHSILQGKHYEPRKFIECELRIADSI